MFYLDKLNKFYYVLGFRLILYYLELLVPKKSMFVMQLLLVAEKYLLRTRRSDGNCAYILAIIIGFFVAIFTFARSIALRMTKGKQDTESDCVQNMPKITVGGDDSIAKEESRPPSPAPRLTKAEVISSALKRLGELEEKVDMLQSKPNVMPYEKEELLNAAVYRVDALEAELIATKKVNCMSLTKLKSHHLLQAKQTEIPAVLLSLKFQGKSLHIVLSFANELACPPITCSVVSFLISSMKL